MHSTLPTKCNCNLIKSNWIIDSQYYSKSSKRAAAQMSNEAMQGLAMRCITSTNMLHFCHRLVWSSHITQRTCCRAFPVAAVNLLLRLLKCQDYSAAITQLRGNFTKFMSKTVAQLNSDVCWQSAWTVPSQPYDWRKRLRLGLPLECQESLVADCSCLRSSQRKGTVAQGSPTSRRYLQCRGVSRAMTVTSDDRWCQPQAVGQVCRWTCGAVC